MNSNNQAAHFTRDEILRAICELLEIKMEDLVHPPVVRGDLKLAVALIAFIGRKRAALTTTDIVDLLGISEKKLSVACAAMAEGNLDTVAAQHGYRTAAEFAQAGTRYIMANRNPQFNAA